MMGAKKFTWNTCCHTAYVVSMVPKRLPPFPLGEMPALLTSACSSPPRRCLISVMAPSVLSGSARSTWMWSSGPIAHGQFSGKAWREQVMTRHPAAAKRFTVAWPMPRLAPVRSSVRRGWFEAGAFGMALTWQSLQQFCRHYIGVCVTILAGFPGDNYSTLWIEPRFRPRGPDIRPAKLNAVMQPERPLVPEFDHNGHQSIANPEWRARHRPDGKLGRFEGDRLFEGVAAFERARLPARPSADLGRARAACEIGVGLCRAHACHCAAQADLAAQGFPVKSKAGPGVCGQFAALPAAVVGIEHEAALVEALEQHHAHIG